MLAIVVTNTDISFTLREDPLSPHMPLCIHLESNKYHFAPAVCICCLFLFVCLGNGCLTIHVGSGIRGLWITAFTFLLVNSVTLEKPCNSKWADTLLSQGGINTNNHFWLCVHTCFVAPDSPGARLDLYPRGSFSVCFCLQGRSCKGVGVDAIRSHTHLSTNWTSMGIEVTFVWGSWVKKNLHLALALLYARPFLYCFHSQFYLLPTSNLLLP